jgi:hypothetical protein
MPNMMEGPPTLDEMFPPGKEDTDVITCWLHQRDSKVTVAFEELKPGDVVTFETKYGSETREVQGVPYRIHLDKGTWTWAVQVAGPSTKG